MAEASSLELRALRSALREQQAQIGALASGCCLAARAQLVLCEQHVELQERHDALCDCLHKAGLIPSVDLLAQLRKRRRSKALGSLLGEPNVAGAVASGAGVSATGRLCTASKSCAECLTSALGELVFVGSSPRVRSAATRFCLGVGPQLPLRVLELRRALEHSLAAVQGAGFGAVVGCPDAVPAWELAARRKRGGNSSTTLQSSEEEQHGGYLVLLQEMWEHPSLQEQFACSLGVEAVQRFRRASRSCLECMRPLVRSSTLTSSRLSSLPARLEPFAGTTTGSTATTVATTTPSIAGRMTMWSRGTHEQCGVEKESGVHQFTLQHMLHRIPYSQLLQWRPLLPRRAVPPSWYQLLYTTAPPRQPPASRAKPQGPTQHRVSRDHGGSSVRQRAAKVKQDVPTSHPPMFTEPSSQKAGSKREGLVKLKNLKTRPDLNGTLGRLLQYTPASHRCDIILLSGEAIRVRPSNVEPVDAASCQSSPAEGGGR
mmetsp:Transcript_56731/g.157026  ORF Transcript_56731/g.157026 Transcript_56731/m.157026 type:complete len:487 (+) Transcript_56731:50-1510(+)